MNCHLRLRGEVLGGRRRPRRLQEVFDEVLSVKHTLQPFNVQRLQDRSLRLQSFTTRELAPDAVGRSYSLLQG
jgi:hypothetical protein